MDVWPAFQLGQESIVLIDPSGTAKRYQCFVYAGNPVMEGWHSAARVMNGFMKTVETCHKTFGRKRIAFRCVWIAAMPSDYSVRCYYTSLFNYVFIKEIKVN